MPQFTFTIIATTSGGSTLDYELTKQASEEHKARRAVIDDFLDQAIQVRSIKLKTTSEKKGKRHRGK